VGHVESSRLGKNQTHVPQLAQQFRILVGKELESSGFVWPNTGDIQNNCGQVGHLRIARLRHPFKVGHVLFGNVRLLSMAWRSLFGLALQRLHTWIL
jgi:hypothetical protein